MSDSKRHDPKAAEDTAPEGNTPATTDDEPLSFESKPASGPGIDRRRLLSLSLTTAAAGYVAPKVLGATGAAGSPDSAQQAVVAEEVKVDLPFDAVLNFVDQRGTLRSNDGTSEYTFSGSGHLHITKDGAVQLSQLNLKGYHIAGPNKGVISVEQEAMGHGSYGSGSSKTALIASAPVRYGDLNGQGGGVAHFDGFVAAGRASFNSELDIYGGTNGSDVYVGVRWSKSC
ncbi:MAG: hypothetical protein AAGC60_01770 [Acidobacteriota bacterium]